MSDSADLLIATMRTIPAARRKHPKNHQQTSGTHLETSPAARRCVKILISDLKIESFPMKKKFKS
jgi:hypothetical protein